MKIAPRPPPHEKSHPPLSQQPPLKVEVLSSPPLFENLVGDSTPLQKRGGGGAHWKIVKFSFVAFLADFFYFALKTYGTLKMFLLSPQSNFYIILSSYVEGNMQKNQVWVSCLWLVSRFPKFKCFFKYFVELFWKSVEIVPWSPLFFFIF